MYKSIAVLFVVINVWVLILDSKKTVVNEEMIEGILYMRWVGEIVENGSTVSTKC